MTSLVTMTTTPAKETLFHVLSNGLYEMFLAGSIDFIYFFLDFLTFFTKSQSLMYLSAARDGGQLRSNV